MVVSAGSCLSGRVLFLFSLCLRLGERRLREHDTFGNGRSAWWNALTALFLVLLLGSDRPVEGVKGGGGGWCGINEGGGKEGQIINKQHLVFVSAEWRPCLVSSHFGVLSDKQWQRNKTKDH